MSSLFGDVDASEVPDDPFYVAPDTYDCILTEANKVEKKDQSGYGLAFKWVIEDEDSEYHGNQIQDWKNIYPDITSDEITPNIRKDMSRLKARLTEMGVPESEMGSLLDNLDDLVGLRAFVTVTESRVVKDGEEKVYSNVKNVRIDE